MLHGAGFGRSDYMKLIEAHLYIKSLPLLPGGPGFA